MIFFNKHDLDAYFVATNAPGGSALNRVERRMSNLSKELSGVILPHDHFGTNLDNNNNTVDEELELKNFEHAGEILDELWSKLVINDHSVVAEFVREEPSDITITKSEEWEANHVRESQYLLQIVKCTDTACCSPIQSSYLDIMKDRFSQPPLPAVFSSMGIELAKDDKETTYLSLFQNVALKDNLLPKHVSTKFPWGIPYNYSCPSTSDALKQNHSPNCRSKKSAKSSHKQSTQPMRKV